jgi:cytochrome P450
VGQAVSLEGEFIQDPYAFYRRVRKETPVCEAIMWGGVRVWLVTRYADARALLSDPRLSKNRTGVLALLPPGGAGLFGSALDINMLNADPPDHTRLRKLVAQAFTMRAVERLRPRVIDIADELLRRVERLALVGPVDLIALYATPLPMAVIGELLGVPETYRDRFRTAVAPLIEEAGRGDKASGAATLIELLTDLIAQKRREPTGDVLSGLVTARNDGDRLTEEELVATAWLLIGAGYETTVNLIGNTVRALLDNPAQLAAIRRQPALVENAVEECLRLASPINIAAVRFTTVEVTIGDITIPPDQLVMIALLGANHDDEQFEQPDLMNIERKPNAHLAFGHGLHHCLGAPLARLEGVTAIGRLLERFDEISLEQGAKLEYRNSAIVHGLKSLPVRLASPPPGRAKAVTTAT